MRTVGAYEAKTHLPRLLDEVERGETIVITRHGVPIAHLVPAVARPQRSVAEINARLRELRSQTPPLGCTVKELIEEGRL